MVRFIAFQREKSDASFAVLWLKTLINCPIFSMSKIEINMAAHTHKQIHIALDFDGTLAYYDKWEGQANKVGPAIPRMVQNVKNWLAKGYKVTIFTARLSHSHEEAESSIKAIKQFLQQNNLPELDITAVKMHYFTHFVDDKAYHVPKNSGVVEGMDDPQILD